VDIPLIAAIQVVFDVRGPNLRTVRLFSFHYRNNTDRWLAFVATPSTVGTKKFGQDRPEGPYNISLWGFNHPGRKSTCTTLCLIL